MRKVHWLADTPDEVAVNLAVLALGIWTTLTQKSDVSEHIDSTKLADVPGQGCPASLPISDFSHDSVVH